MINDVISGSRHSTEKKNCEGFFNWLGAKLFNDNYLNKTIDFIIKQAIQRIKNFSDKIKSESEKFKKDIIDEITSSKERVVEELKQKQEEEELEKKKSCCSKWRGKKTMGRRKKVSWRKEKKMGDAM